MEISASSVDIDAVEAMVEDLTFYVSQRAASEDISLGSVREILIKRLQLPKFVDGGYPTFWTKNNRPS